MDVDEKLEAHTLNTDMEKEEGEGEKITIEASSHRNPQNVEESQINIPPSLEHHIDRDGPASVKVSKKGRKRKSSDSSCLPNKKAQTCLKDNSSNKDEISHILTASSHKISSQSTQDPNADIEGEMSGPDMFSAPEDLTDTELQLEQNKKKIASLNVRSPTYQSQRSCEKSVESSQNSVSLLQPRPVYLAQSKDPAIIVDEEESSNEVEEDNNKEKENKNKRTPKTMSRKKAVSGDGEMESEDEDDSKRRRSGVRAIRGLASKINITNVTPERFAALENKGDYDGKGGGVDSDLFKSPQVIQETPRLGDRPRKFSKTINKMERDTETLREDSNFVSPTPPVTKVTSPPQLSTQTRGVTRFSPKQSGSFKVPVTQMCQDEGQDSSPSGTQAMPSTASPHLSRREQIRLEKRKAFEKEEEDLYGDDVILVNMEEEEAVQTEVEEDIRETMASLDKDIFSAESEEEDTANRDVKEDLNGSKYNPVELDSDEDSIPDEEMAEPLIKRSKEIAEIISDEEEEAVKNISSKYEGQDTEEDEEDLHTFRRNRTRKAVISDDEEDEDENSGEDGRVTPHNAVSHNLTSSSAVSSQSDTNTEGRELLAADMEQLQNEIAQLEAQLMQKNDTLSLSNIEGIVADDTRSRSRASSTNSESEGGRVSESDMTRLQNQIAELEAQLQAQNSTIPSKYMELSDDEEDEVCMVEEENISTPCQRIRSSGDRLSKDDQMNTNEQDTRISGVSSKSKRMNNNGGGDINKEGENEVEEIALEENEQEDEEMQENVIEVKGDDEDVEEDKENNEDMQEEVDEEDVEEEANMEEELAEIAAQLKAHNAGMMKRGALSDDEEDLDEHAQHNIHDNDEMNMKEDNQMDTVPDSGEDGGLEGNNNYHQSDNDLFNVASPRSPTPPPSQSALTDDTEAQNVETEQDSELPNVLGQDVLDLQTVDEIPATPEAEETEIPEELRKALEVLEKYKMSPSINIPLVKNVVQKEKKSTPSRKHLADIHLNDREDRKRKGKSSPYSRKQKIERVKGEKTNTATGHHGVSPLLNSEAESQVKVEKTSPKVKVMGELDVSTQRLPPRRTSSIQKRLITPIKASPLSRDASLPLPSGVSPLVASVGTTPLSSRSSASRTSPDLNSEFPSKPHWSFLTSGIGRLSIKRQIEKLARLIGSDVPIPSKFSTRTTHVLLSQHPESDDRLVCQRTLKYFQGIAGSRWVLHYSWVVDSLQAGKLLPEEQYEMQGCNIHTSAQASRKSRLARKPILHHYEVCCHGNFTDLTKEDLHGMIEMSGATLVQDPAMFSFDAHLTQVIIIEDNEDKNLRQLQKVARKYDVPIVGKDWLLDSLSLYQVADISDYSAVEP